MNLGSSIRRQRVVAVALAVFAGLACSAVHAQSWDYKSYKKRAGQFDRENFVVGTLTLEEKDGKAFVHMVAGVTDACLRGDVPATVTKTDTTTTIELQSLPSCEQIRYVIRNDGSGGRREVKRGDNWANDTFDHGLTLKK